MNAASAEARQGSVNIAVIGGGPAASATAYGLARAGLSVWIIEKGDDTGGKIGESLAPSARPLLRQLGVWERFSADGHLACYGNRSAWGSERLDEYDFIQDPNGHGWHIDRRRFEAMLVEQARAAGAHRFLRTRVTGWRREAGGGWRLSLEGPGAPSVFTAGFIVDATGRASWFARQQGARRLHDDRMVSLVAFLATDREPEQHLTTLVEAMAGGWWYSAPLPDRRLATSYMTDADLISSRSARTAAGWERLLAETRYTAERVRVHGYRLTTPPRFVSASSSRLTPVSGDGWLATGDAATAFDPLSSHGIAMALVGGVQAAAAIVRWLAGDGEALSDYGRRLRRSYETYLHMRATYYALEHRWPNAPFWQRRSWG